MRDAVFVARLGARRPPRAFRKYDELAFERELDAGALDHRRQRLRAFAAVDRHAAGLDGEPAEHREPLQLALEDEHRIVEQRLQREGFPGRLVLGRDDDRTGRDLVAPADLAFDAGDHAQQHQIGPPPRLRHRQNGGIGHEEGRQRDQQIDERVQVEQHVEGDGTQNDHGMPVLTRCLRDRGACGRAQTDTSDTRRTKAARCRCSATTARSSASRTSPDRRLA